MKKIYTLFLTFLYAGLALANGVEIDGIYYLLNDDTNTAIVTYPNETVPVWRSTPSTYSGTIVIPDSVSYNGQLYTVTAIGNNAFLNSKLTSITLPNTIISIGAAAFFDHRGITNLELPNLQSVGNEAFRYCTTLQKVVIPESIVSLGITAFQRCVNLAEIQLPKSLKSLPNHIFFACSALKEITLPPSITAIPDECFRSCASLKKITIPETVTNIRYMAFRGCESIEEFIIPQNVAVIGEEIIGGYPGDPYTGGAVPQYTGLTRLKSVFIDASTPPECHTNAFRLVDNSKVNLFVKEGSVDIYRNKAEYANHFKGIYAFGKGVVNVMDATDSSALISWFPYPDVVEYTIGIFTSDTLFAQYVVDGEGNVTDTVKSAAVIGHAPKKKLDSRETFTISIGGLKSNTIYSYSIVGTDGAQQQIYKKEGVFRTKNRKDEIPTELANDSVSVKINYKGHIYILRGEDIYTVQGQRIK